MGIANDLKGLTMLGRFAPNSLALLALLVVILQCVYNNPALAKPRPQQYINIKQWTDNVNDRHGLHIDSIGSPESQRHKREADKREDVLKDQNGFKVLTASTEKRTGIETPIEPLKSQDSTVSNDGQNLRSKVNQPNGGRSEISENTDNGSTESRSEILMNKPEGNTPTGSSLKSVDVNGQKRVEVSTTNSVAAKNDGSKTQTKNASDDSKIKQESVSTSSTGAEKGNDKPNTNTNGKLANQETQGSHPASDSVTIQGNTINGRPMSSANSEPVRDPLGNSGSEVVTSHPLFEDPGENSRYPYRDARSKEKASTEPEVGHFQVDDKSADLEINANSAGVKVKAKPASLQVVSRPGAHPPTPIVPVAPLHPFYHHHHHYAHYHPFFGYRRSMRPYHRRLYDNSYHAHYRNWIPPPGHHFHRYWRHYHEDEPSYRRSYEPYRYHYPYPFHHRHHHRYRYPDSDLFDRSSIEDDYPRYGFRSPYNRRWYRRGYRSFDTRFHIPRRPGPYVRNNIVTPMPPPVNVYGNPPPAILENSPAARYFGANPFSGMPNMGEFGPGMQGLGMQGPEMQGPGLAGLGMFTPGMGQFGMQGFGMPGQMDSDQGLEQPEENGFPARNVKKTSIQGDKKKTGKVKTKSTTEKKKKKQIKKAWKKFLNKSHNVKSNATHSNASSIVKHRSRRSVDTEPKKKKTTHKLRPEKTKEQKGARKNSIVIHRPPIIYHPPPEIYHRPDIVVHRAPIMLHRPAIIYHQPPVVVHRPAIIYHQPSIVFHQPPPVVHQPIMHSHDTYVTKPVVYHSTSMVSHATNFLGIPNHVYSGDFDGGFHAYHGFHGNTFRKHGVPHTLKTKVAEIQGKMFKKSDTSKKGKVSRPKRDIYAEYLEHLDSMISSWAQKTKRNAKDDFDILATKEAASEALTYRNGEDIEKRDYVNRVHDKKSRSRKKRDIDEENYFDGRISSKKKKDVVVNRPPIIYHPPPEVYHRPDIVVHRPPLVIHRPPIIYHQPPVIVHRPAVVYHQPPIVFHQPPPAVSQPLLFSHDSFTVHPSFYATHHGSVVKDYGHYIGIPNIVSNYGAPLFHSAMGKRSKINKPWKKAKKSKMQKTNKKSKLHKTKPKTEKPHKKNSVLIRRPPIIYHPPPEIYHRPDIVVHRAPIMIHRAPIVYHQPPVVVHRPAIVYHQPSLVFHQPPPVVHQPLLQSHDTWVTHSVAVPYSSHVSHHHAYIGIPKHAYMNYHHFWDGEGHGNTFYKSQVPKAAKASQRDQISKNIKKRKHKKTLKRKKDVEEKAKRKNSVMIRRPPIIYHPPPEIFHRPDIVVHRPPILVHRAPIIYHQPPVIVHRPAIVYHQPSVVFHQPSPIVHQPIMQAHDTWVTRPVAKLYGSTLHHLGAVTQIPHAYFNGHHHVRYMAYGKSKVPAHKKDEEASSRDKIKHVKVEEDDYDDSGSGSGDDIDENEYDDDVSGISSGSGELDIEVIKDVPVKSKVKKSKPLTEDASKKDKIAKHKEQDNIEKTVNGSKKNSVVIHRPPIIYHPPPEIYHRPDIVVHRAPIVLYRAPIIYHQPPVVVHRPAIVYHQPSLVFHQPPPVVHQPVMHSHDTYVTHSVVVPVGSHISHVGNYHGVPHEEIYMEGVGHGAFAKSMLPLRKSHKRDKIRKDKSKVRNRRAVEDLPPATEDLKRPVGAGVRIRRAIEEPWDKDLDADKRRVHGKTKKRSSKKKKKDVVVSRPPIIYHPPPEVYHRPEIVVHRAPILIHRPPIVYHQPPVVVHRPAVVYHQPPIVFHQPPPAVNQPLLYSHDQYVLHPSAVAQHINSVVNEGGHYIGVPHGGIENYPGSLHSFNHMLPSFSPSMPVPGYGAGYKRTKVQRPDKKEVKKTDKDDIEESSGSESGDTKKKSKKSKAQKVKHTKGERKNNVLVYRPPMVYHPPPEIYDRPDIVVHRPDIVVHRPAIVYHQSSVVIHRPPIVYTQPPVVFHQPPPLTHQPIIKSHDLYRAHHYFEPYGSEVHHAGSYTGAPHFFPGVNPYGWGMQQYEAHGPELGPVPGPTAQPPYGPINGSPYGPAYGAAYGPGYGAAYGPAGPVGAGLEPVGPSMTPGFGPAYGRSDVEKRPKKSKKGSKKSQENASKRSKERKGRHKRSTKMYQHHLNKEPIYHLMEHHETFFANSHLHNNNGETVQRGQAPFYTKSKVSSKDINSKITMKSKKGKINKNKQKKGSERKNVIVVHRPPMVYHPPPEIYDRPDVVVHRPDLVIHRPSIVYHQSSVVVHRPPIIYHEPPVMFHQPPPLVHQPVLHAHDSYIGHTYYEPYGSHVQHAGTYVGAPHYYPPSQYSTGPWAPAFGKSKIEKNKKKDSKHRSKRSTKKQKKVNKTGSKKNKVLIMRPPLIYHPPPEIYDRPSIIVHRPDLVIHRPSIVYHQPSVVIHRPPIVYQQPPVVFHQPPPMNTQPVIHAHDYYMAHTYHEPYASHIAHAGTYVGAPHYFPGGWGFGPHPIGFGAHHMGSWAPAFAKSKVPNPKNKSKKVKRSTKKSHKNLLKTKKRIKKGDKKNIVIAHRPPMIYHPPPEIYDRPDVVVHRPDLVIHRPSIVYHQSSVVVHRPPIIYHQPPVVFHQPSPMVHQPIMHSHDTYVGHQYYEPHSSVVSHAGSYVGAPHFYGGGFGYGYGGFAPAYAKSEVSKSTKKSAKGRKNTKVLKRPKRNKGKEKQAKAKKSESKTGSVHKKNLVVMRRPSVVYHPPPEIYHRPDVILHRPDIVIHRPSVVFHQPAVVIHRPAVVYHQPPLVFHQPPPMVHQPVMHSHETYLPHHYFEPHHSHVTHAGTYVGAPHFFHGGWGWGYGYHGGPGHAFGKSKVEENGSETHSKKLKPNNKTADKEEDDDDDDEEDEDETDDDDSKKGKSKNKAKRSLKSQHKDKKASKVVDGHKKNVVVMHRPSVIYHPPPEVYHRPDVVLHRPDIVIHRPSVVFHQPPVLLHRPAVVYHQSPIVFHQPPPMVHQPILHSHDAYIPHHFFEPFHSHLVHGGTYVGAPHYFGGGWGWGYGHGHAFGKSKVEKKTKKVKHHKSKRDIHKVDEQSDLFRKFLTKRSIKGMKRNSHSRLNSKKTAKGSKKNTVLIHRPPMIYHPPPEIYDRPNIVVHRPDLVYHQPSIVYHQSSVVIHRPPIIYHPPPVVFHQPPPLVHQNILHAHDSYVAHQYFEPYASQIHGGGTYVGAPHFFGGGWGYGYGMGGRAPFMHPYGQFGDFGFSPNRPMPFYNGFPFNGAAPFPAGPYAFHDAAPQPAGPIEAPAVAKSEVEGVYKKKKKHHKRHKRSLTEKHHSVKYKRIKSKNSHHKGHKKHMIVMNRPSIVLHQPPEVYHRPDVVFHRPDIVIHRPDIVMHQAPVVVHKPSVVLHQPPVIVHQPPPLVHQPILYSHDTYVPRPYYEPFNSHVEHVGTYVGAPHAYPGGWGYGYGHVVGGYGKSHVEKSESKKTNKSSKRDHKNKQVKASKKGDILHAEEKKEVKADKKNDIVVSRPPIIYHPPPEIYHRPDIVVHRAPIVLHRPPIIYHQPPVVVHRPAVVYHQPSIVFHQPPPAVHQPIIHSHDTFVVHHSALYEPHGSTVSHETNYIGIPSHVEHFDEGMGFEGMHHGYHGGFHGGFHAYHSGFHGFHGGYQGRPGYLLHRSNIEHVKKSSRNNEREKESSKSTIPKKFKRLNFNTDKERKVSTRRKRQVIGSHSLYLPETPLNLVHPRGPIVERLQKMSTIPHAPNNNEIYVSKRDTTPKRKKRQIENTPQKLVQTPVNLMESTALPNRRIEILQPAQSAQPFTSVSQEPRLLYQRLPIFPSLAGNPFVQGFPPFRSPEVNVHVQTDRSKIPTKIRKAKSRKKRQVLPYVQPQLLGSVPNLMMNSPSNGPFAIHHFFPNQVPQLPFQMSPQYIIHPMPLPYQMMNFGPRRPHVNINVQSARSNIPNSSTKQRTKRSSLKGRRKRQIFAINPYMMPLNSFVHGYGGPYMMYPNFRMFNPYWNMNQYFFRRGPGIPHPEQDQDNDSDNLTSLFNQYLTNLYEYYTGNLFHHKRPKVSVDVHASKSNIPGSKPRDIEFRNRRQLMNYLPVSPLTTGQYHFSMRNILSKVSPLKRSTIMHSRTRRSAKESSVNRKIKDEKEQNSKRDEFMPQKANSNEQNQVQIDPNNPGPVQFANGEQNDQPLNARAESLNEFGPGGLNAGDAAMPAERPQVQQVNDEATGEEQKYLNDNVNLQQDAIQPEQVPSQLPKEMTGFPLNGENIPSFAQLQEPEGENRMVVPDQGNEMLQVRGQAPFLPPVSPMLPPVQSPFFPAQPEVLPQPVPYIRPFAPFPLIPQLPFIPFNAPLQPQVPFNAPLQPQVQSFTTEPTGQPSVNINVNTVKSNLPGTKSKKKDSNNTGKVVRKTVPDSENKRSAKRQRISLLRRIPALQVLPQTLLQNGVQIPFTGTHDGKEVKSHGVNGMIISELQRKHAIPAKSKDKLTAANKRQFYQLPIPMNDQPIQPFLNPAAELSYPSRPQVHVHVDVGKRKSELSASKHISHNKSKTKVKRQIYGMNELPHGLKFPEEVADLSGDKINTKKFKIRSDGDSDSKDLPKIKISKRDLDSSIHDSKKETSKKKLSLKVKAKKSDDADKRQYVLGGENTQEYYGDHAGEDVQHVSQFPQQAEQYQSFSQAGPQPLQNTAEHQVLEPQQIIQDQAQQYTNPLQRIASQAVVPVGAHLIPQHQVNVNVQVSKSDINKKDKSTSGKATVLSKRQLFGTVPLLNSFGINPTNIGTKEGNERSRVPDTKTSEHSNKKRELVASQQPNHEVTNEQKIPQNVHRRKRQLYDILSGKQAQEGHTKQPQKF